MSDYLRIRTLVEFSEHSDYHRAQLSTLEATGTPDEWEFQKVDAAVAGTTVELGNYTTVTHIVVENTDDTNYVTATHVFNALSVAARVSANSHIIIYGPTVASDLVLTANTAACTCRVWIAGT